MRTIFAIALFSTLALPAHATAVKLTVNGAESSHCTLARAKTALYKAVQNGGTFTVSTETLPVRSDFNLNCLEASEARKARRAAR